MKSHDLAKILLSMGNFDIDMSVSIPTGITDNYGDEIFNVEYSDEVIEVIEQKKQEKITIQFES